jgi:hypothetical protein
LHFFIAAWSCGEFVSTLDGVRVERGAAPVGHGERLGRQVLGQGGTDPRATNR